MPSEFRRLLQFYVDARAQSPQLKYRCPEEVVLAHGIVPKRKLKSPVQGAPNMCFNNSVELAGKIPNALYTEGYFMSVIPIHHAWVTLPDGSIYDPTLDDERGVENYLGIPFTRAFTAKHLRTGDGWPAVLIQHDMFNIDVLKGKFEVATFT